MSKKHISNNQIIYNARIQSMKRLQDDLDKETLSPKRQKGANNDGQRKMTNHQQLQFNKRRLRSVIIKNKVDLLAQTFVNKIKLLGTNRGRPPKFTQLEQAKYLKYRQLYQVNGIAFHPIIKNLIGFMYLIGLIICYFIGSWQGFIELFWENQTATTTIIILKVISAVFFFLYLMIKILSTQLQMGKSRRALQQITIANLKSISFYIILATFIGSILFNIFLGQAMGIIMFCIVLVNVNNIFKIISQITLLYADTFYIKQYSRLVILFCFNLMFAHLIASILLAISFIDGTGAGWQVTFISQEDLQQWFVVYIWSFYWAATIMMTVGFGDFSAAIWEEAVIIAFLEITAVMVLAYIISEVMNIISDLRAYSIEIEADLGTFKRMTNHSQIPEQLILEIQSYIIESGALKRNFQFGQQKQLLDKLPEPLKKSFLTQSNKVIFSKLPFFKYLSPTTTLIYFANNVEGKIFYPSQKITNKNGELQNFTILKNGKVGLAFRKQGAKFNGIILHQIKVRMQKKEQPILLNTDILSEAKCTNIDLQAQQYTFCYLLPYDKFFEGLKEFRLDYQYYFSALHRHQIVRKVEGYGIKCQYCSTDANQSKQLIHLYHTVFECPKLHYIPFEAHIIQKAQLSGSKKQGRSKLVKRQRNSRMLYPLKLWRVFYKPCSINWGTIQVKQSSNSLSEQNHPDSPIAPHQMQIDSLIRQNQRKNSKVSRPSGVVQRQSHRLNTIIRNNFEEIAIRYMNTKNRDDQVQQDDIRSFNVDQAHNYTSYFLIANPSRLIEFPLGKKRRDKISLINFMRVPAKQWEDVQA